MHVVTCWHADWLECSPGLAIGARECPEDRLIEALYINNQARVRGFKQMLIQDRGLILCDSYDWYKCFCRFH